MKLAGGLLILWAVVWFSYAVLRGKRMRADTLLELSVLMARMCGELETHAAPIPELLAALAPGAGGAGKLFLETLREGLSRLGAVEFSKLWDAAVQTVLPASDTAADRELHLAGMALGRYELRRQCEVLEQCSRELRSDAESVETELSQNRRLLWGLSLAVAALLIILLI